MNENDIKRAQEVVDNWDKTGGSTAHLFQAALTLAQAFTLSRQGYQSEQALRVQEQNRADRLAVEASENNKAAHEAEQKWTHRARTIIVTRTARMTDAEDAAAAEAWKAKGKDQAYYPMRGGYWQVEEDGKVVDGLAIEEATHAVLQLMINAHPDRMRLRTIDELEHEARETGKRMGVREVERAKEQEVYTPETKPKPEPDPQDNDARYDIILMALAGILKDFGAGIETDRLFQIDGNNYTRALLPDDFEKRGYSPYNAQTLHQAGKIAAAVMNLALREWEKGGQPTDKPDIGDAIALGLAGYRPDLVTAKGEGVTLKTRPRRPTEANVQQAFYAQRFREAGYKLIGVDLGKDDTTTTWSEHPARGGEFIGHPDAGVERMRNLRWHELDEQRQADMQADRRAEVESLKRLAPDLSETEISGMVDAHKQASEDKK